MVFKACHIVSREPPKIKHVIYARAPNILQKTIKNTAFYGISASKSSDIKTPAFRIRFDVQKAHKPQDPRSFDDQSAAVRHTPLSAILC